MKALVTDIVVSAFCLLFAVSSFFTACIYYNAGKDYIATADLFMALVWLAAAFKTPLEKLKKRIMK